MSESRVSAQTAQPPSAVGTLADHRHGLCWAAALLAFGLGDILTTGAGLSMGLVEANPVAGGLLATHGIAGVVGLKAAMFAFAGGVYAALSSPKRLGIPAGLALVGVSVTAWNGLMLAVVVA